MTPPPFPPPQARNSFGKSNIFPSQSNISTSNSVQAGLANCVENLKRIHLEEEDEIYYYIDLINYFYPRESYASNGTAEHVSNDCWIRLGCWKICVKFRAVPVSDLEQNYFFVIFFPVFLWYILSVIVFFFFF